MDDLISRERALEALREANIRVTGMRVGKTILAKYADQVRDGYIDILKELPAEDAELIRTGHWINCGKTEKGSPIRRCSYCGVTKAGRPLSDYCPDCGCKMFGRTSVSDGADIWTAVRLPFVRDDDDSSVVWEPV